ncbi:DUF4352 domain-containing protein [Bacillus salacetis]|uniref:DUF4352 domain-containing protein n=1 Tax=Bacillus salacetis TaxID=2315464 RepID=A0A3A1QS38_9BACI|nr:DUF4352 domain-containing protein [Bacillus salacetis]RIW29374.1 DUF4352 domain-containing protein [Bacillus salacetis]
MRKWWVISLVLAVLLTACGDNEGNSTEASGEQEAEKTESNKGNKGEGVAEGGEVLGLGDTIEFQSNIGNYKLTINSVESMEEYQGETPQREIFLAVEVTVENLAEEPLVADDAAYLRLTSDVDSSGTLNILLGDMEVWDKELEKGESDTRKLFYDTQRATEYSLLYNHATENHKLLEDVKWVFTDEEVD